VVVSARGTEHDRVHALEIGADDYLVKPFSMKELVARVRAAARRGVRVQDENRGDPIEVAELRIDPLNVQAYVNGKSAELTPTEFRLLYALALDRGRVVTRDEVLQKVWGRRQTHRDRTVDVFVRKLRDKIDALQPKHTFIQTRYGVGYKLEAGPQAVVGGASTRRPEGFRIASSDGRRLQPHDERHPHRPGGRAARGCREADGGARSRARCSSFPTTRLEGILTERDLMKAVAAGYSEDAKVGDWMTRHPETIEADDSTGPCGRPA
jgi:DNA-binding winged helix-turn-helix (wHTH) protein